MQIQSYYLASLSSGYIMLENSKHRYASEKKPRDRWSNKQVKWQQSNLQDTGITKA